METLFHFIAPPSTCGYLPEQQWSLEYELVAAATPAEYMQRMAGGWRRFGVMFFRPRCPECRACQSIRVPVERFRPDRSQRRCHKLNAGDVEMRVGAPAVTRAKLALYDRYHADQTERKGWPAHPTKDADSYAQSFVDNPFRTEEWCYFLGGQLVGVGYVDALPGGLSAIYFFYEPELRDRSLGTFNVLCAVAEAARRGLPHLYLGYYVPGCESMLYKARFVPNEILGPDGRWREFRTRAAPRE